MGLLLEILVLAERKPRTVQNLARCKPDSQTAGLGFGGTEIMVPDPVCLLGSPGRVSSHCGPQLGLEGVDPHPYFNKNKETGNLSHSLFPTLFCVSGLIIDSRVISILPSLIRNVVPSLKAHKEECFVCALPAVLHTSFRLF